MDRRDAPPTAPDVWTDPIRRSQLSPDELAALPPNPAGSIELPELPADDDTDRTDA